MDLRWIWWAFAAVGAYYLFTAHSAHLLDYLPFILLMACPLMHFFHRHGGSDHKHHEKEAS